MSDNKIAKKFQFPMMGWREQARGQTGAGDFLRLRSTASWLRLLCSTRLDKLDGKGGERLHTQTSVEWREDQQEIFR